MDDSWYALEFMDDFNKEIKKDRRKVFLILDNSSAHIRIGKIKMSQIFKLYFFILT